MFESLSDRLTDVFRSLTGQGRLTEENIQSGLREVRLALLEADVNFKVVKDFVETVRRKCIGQEILKGVNPAQQVIKIVHDELVEILGGTTTGLSLTGRPASSIMLVGLQGSGKTTSAAKLANLLRKQKMHPYLVPLDVYRPAAIDQLMSLARQLNVPCFPSTTDMRPQDIARKAREKASEEGADLLLLDTAGRLHVDEPLMQELGDLKEILAPDEILFVADAMTGQDAVTVAQAFHDRLNITGVVLTKMDGDARGGAALSIRSVIGAPVKFVGMGEKLSEMEVFHPDRIAGRILGMGDILTLVEKAQEEFDEEEALRLSRKIKKASFDYEDFRTQMQRIKKMGPLESILKLIPGMGALKNALNDVSKFMPEKELARAEAIISSMTVEERHNPELLNSSRRARIARGAGVTTQDVTKLTRSFDQMRKMMKGAMTGKGMPQMDQNMLRQMNRMSQGGFGNNPGMTPGMNPMLPSVDGLFPQLNADSDAAQARSANLSELRKKKKKEKRKHGKK